MRNQEMTIIDDPDLPAAAPNTDTYQVSKMVLILHLISYLTDAISDSDDAKIDEGDVIN